jgi:hypothetical protein
LKKKKKTNREVFMKQAFIILAVLVLTAGCATFQEAPAPPTYVEELQSVATVSDTVSEHEITFQELITLFENGQNRCEKGELSTEQCERAKTEYNLAREDFILAGDSLKEYINTTDVQHMKKYLELMGKVKEHQNNLEGILNE